MQTDESGLDEVRDSIMVIFEGYGTLADLEKIRAIASNGHRNCDLGSIPACTCGNVEAKNFMSVFEGQKNMKDLLR